MKKILFLFVVIAMSVSATEAGAQAFQGPCGNPPSGNCGIIFASTTRALQIGTSTIYSVEPKLIFQTYGGSNQHINFLPNGNVGIATTTPGQKLTVVGNIFATGNIQGTTLTGALSGILSAGNVSSEVFGSQSGGGSYSFPASVGIATSSQINLPQPLSVYGNAYVRDNVGIGSAANPTGKLDIVGSSGTVRVDLTGRYLDYTFSGTNYLRATGGSGALAFITGGAVTTPDLFITSAGDVGIGTSTPMAAGKLVVDGTAYINNLLNVRGINMLGGTNITMNGGNITGANKITVTTLDPLYDIKGTKYSTYAPSIAGGVYEELIGKGRTTLVGGGIAEFRIDFDSVKKGSDLWVWKHAVDFSKENIAVMVTPYGAFVDAYYLVEGNSIVVRTSEPTEFSYRLSGKRFDWKKWPTRAIDQTETPSLIVP